jgi:hypothetical protein
MLFIYPKPPLNAGYDPSGVKTIRTEMRMKGSKVRLLSILKRLTLFKEHMEDGSAKVILDFFRISVRNAFLPQKTHEMTN